jgi:hypothetical protein
MRRSHMHTWTLFGLFLVLSFHKGLVDPAAKALSRVEIEHDMSVMGNVSIP